MNTKKIFLTLLFGLALSFLCQTGVMAQSQYISNSRADSLDTFGSLDGKRGVMLVSKSNNLVITVPNASETNINPLGQGFDGYYRYEVLLGADDTNPKIEVNIRGDVNMTSFVATPKPDFFVAYLIDLVATPIELQDQTGKASAILDARYCEVEITSPLPDLHVEAAASIEAQIKTSQRQSDNSLYVTSVVIPVEKLNALKQAAEEASEAFDKHNKWLIETDEKKLKDSDYDRDDELQAASVKAQSAYNEATQLTIYGDGTNVQTISLEGMAPRVKKSYVVLLLNKEKKVYVTECSAKLTEAGRLFGLREYGSAKTNFQLALDAADAPEDLKPSIRAQLQQCDSCDYYQNMANRAIGKIAEGKKQGTLTQAILAKYAAAAAEYLRLVYKYNPIKYYQDRIASLDKLIGEMPLEFHITVKKWVKDESGFYEGGSIANVEVWAYYGTEPLQTKYFATDSKFEKTVGKSTQFKKLETSDGNGNIELQLDRNQFPNKLLFHAVGYDNRFRTDIEDFNEMLNRSSGDYIKRQFRIKMFEK